MDSLGGDGDNIRKHGNSNPIIIDGCSTEDFDTQSPSSTSTSSSGEEPKDVQFDDTVRLEDETQLLNLDAETQELDGLDWDDNVRTQLLNECEETVCVDSDGEGSDRTEVLSYSDDECERVRCEQIGKDFVMDSDPSSDKEYGSASLRASDHGTAHVMISKGNVDEPSSFLKNIESCKEHLYEDAVLDGIRDPTSVGTIVREVNRDHDTQNCNEHLKGFHYETKCKGANSTVKKVFNKDAPTWDNRSVHDNEPELLVCNREFAGLSYVESQEPGEESQANALDIVDKFLSINDVELSPEVDLVKTVKGTPPRVSRVSGTQSLAKGMSLRNPVKEVEIFDWRDSCEDEGGGDFFKKREETFFGSRTRGRRSLKKPQQPRVRSSVDKLKGKEESLYLCQKIMGLTRLDPRSMFHDSKKNDKILQKSKVKTKKKFLEVLDEQPNAECPEQPVDTTDIGMDLPEFYDVGFDTQMAAEAMEALVCATDLFQVRQDVIDDSSRGITKTKVRSEHKRLPSSDSRGIARRSKRTKMLDAKLNNETTSSSRKRFKKPKMESGQASEVKMVAKKSNSKAEEHLHNGNGANGKENSDYMTFTPIACRTRQSKAAYSWKGLNSSNGSEERTNNPTGVSILGDKRKRSSLAVDGTNTLSVKGKSSMLDSNQICEVRKNIPNQQEHSGICEPREEIPTTSYDKSYPSGRRTRWNMSNHLNNVINLDQLSTLADVLENNGQSIPRRKRSKVNVRGLVRAKSSVHSIRNNAENGMIEALVEGKVKPSRTSATPLNCTTPINVASPICKGDDYKKRLSKKSISRSSRVREIIRLDATEAAPTPTWKDLRKRRDMANVRVLFSHHLDEDIIKQQKKISARLGVSITSSSSEATHFVTDEFVRTRNMLEAIALGKPVVTHLWLESCEQANCFINEKNYILRDPKKEKEIGFSMPVSLARACQSPLLQGKQIFITPNVKPSRELIASLVKAVHGQVVEKIGGSAMKKDNKIDDNLLILSCEEDYEICVPLREKGATIHSSELLLNGIVIQKLENERHILFADHVKRNRSTIRMRKDGIQFLPVTKCK